MKIKIFLILALTLMMPSINSFGQAIITRKDSISLANDTIVKIVIPPYRGNIQWQKSFDGSNWNNIPGENSDTLKVKTDTEAIYRGRITEGNCLPVYSDPAFVMPGNSVSTQVINPKQNGWKLVTDIAAISKGIYTYTQTGSSAGFEVGKVILDEESGGTIRRITGISQREDTVSLTTTQASMEDVFRNITFRLSTEMIQPSINLKSAGLQELEKSLTDEKGIIHPVEVTFFSGNGEMIKRASIYDQQQVSPAGDLFFNYPWSGLTLFEKSGTFTLPDENGVEKSITGSVKFYISEGYITFDPVFLFDYIFETPEIDWDNLSLKGGLKSFSFTCERSKIDIKNMLTCEASVDLSVKKEFTIKSEIINAKFMFLVGKVFVWIDVKIHLKCALSASLSSGLIVNTGFQSTNYLTLGLGYRDGNWQFPFFNFEPGFKLISSTTVPVSHKLKFDIYPVVETKIYSLLGPYFQAGPFLQKGKTISDHGNWNENYDTGADAEVGIAMAEILGKLVPKFDPVSTNLATVNLYSAPFSMTLTEGEDQSAPAGERLPKLIVVKVTDSNGDPVERVKVYFEVVNPASGDNVKAGETTAIDGLARTEWYLSDQTGEHELKIYVKDGKDQEIQSCTLSVKATATNPAHSIELVSAGNLTGALGQPLPEQVVVKVKDKDGNPFQGAPVYFTAGNNGSVSAGEVKTGSNGTASVTWTLGPADKTQTLTIKAYKKGTATDLSGSPVTVNATAASSPTLTTASVTNITLTSAQCGGNVTYDGGSPVTTRGVCWNTTGSPTISNSKTSDGAGIGSFTSTLSGLTPDTKYFVQAYATNSQGTAYGGEATFITEQIPGLPVVTTGSVTNVTETSAVSGGNVISAGASPVIARGVCWSIAENPTVANSKTFDGTGTGTFTSSLTGLMTNTPYYMKAYATNSAGTAYGSQITFTTSDKPTGTFTDGRDGKTYKWVKIGSQTWMAENLAWLPSVSPPTPESSTIPNYYVYDYNGTNVSEAKATSNFSTYGVLYNWPAAMNGAESSNENPSGVQGACPTGWHLPSDAEWFMLHSYLINNGYGYQGSGGSIAKSMASMTNWDYYITPGTPGNDPGSNNSSGFSGFPAGMCYNGAAFIQVGNGVVWWTSTKWQGGTVWIRRLLYTDAGLIRTYLGEKHGFSVRCLKN